MLIGQDVTVLGAGIGGLTAAIALARRGARVQVLEQASRISEVGAGVQIAPNAMAVLRDLGLDTEIAARSLRGQAVNLLDGRNGRQVLRMDLAALRPEQEWLFVHRADLIAVLLAAARDLGVEIRLGQLVVSVDTEGDALWLRVPGGNERVRGLLIGADGVRSVARAAAGPAPAAEFTGQVAWRALVPMPEAVTPEVRVFMGPGRHLVAYPLRDARLLNIVAVQQDREWADEGWNFRDDPAALQQAFSGFTPEIKEILDQVTEVHRWGLFRHPVAARWHRGRLALLGDAAHPTLPFLAQGACMAMEDAWVMADSLAQAEAPEAGLALYQARRRARCVRIVEAANRNARAYHLAGPVRTLAHAGLRLAGGLAPSLPLRRFDWLYGHDVTAI